MSSSDIYILAMPAIAAAAVLLTGAGLAVFLKRQSRDGKRVGATERSNRRAQGIVDKDVVDGVWVNLTKAQFRALRARISQPVRTKRRV
jgi:hypothetical protein